MVEVKDEILASEPLFRITDKDGNILFDEVTIEMITKIIQAPTLLNRVLLYAIQQASLNEIKLTSSYSKTNFDNITDFTLPSLNAQNTQGFIASYDSNNTWSGGINVYQMFNGDGNSAMQGGNGTIYLEAPCWIKPTSFTWEYQHARTTIYASTDNINWDTLVTHGTAGAVSKNTQTVNTDSNKYYKYFKFAFTPYETASMMKIYNSIKIQGKKANEIENVYITIGKSTDQMLTEEYFEGQIVKIETPSNYIPADNMAIGLKIYNLGIATLPTDLEASTKYTLVYDGKQFVKEV